ncbi:MAG: glycosyltransferase [Candidatus Marinimicrobia bacterium]|nr:glycosyltransferase [Candidatus Neomarinimicrobiota bacterium]
MESNHKKVLFSRMMDRLKSFKPVNWNDITDALSVVKENAPPLKQFDEAEFFEKVRKGIGFWTFDFGIDGVSIEISKYAQCLQDILSNEEKASIHLISGDFHSQADSVIKPEWHRFHIPRVNGWLKWDNGVWFDKLFYRDMPEGSPESDEVAVAIWNQAVGLAEKLGAYIAEKDLSLLIPVNVNSNPGNLATGMCTVLVSELMGLYVINSNHDFYWEGGKPASQKKIDEASGPRDKFFRNIANRPFFSMFEKIYPWNGKRWLQININKPQSNNLVEKLGFPKDRVFEISTSVSDEFFKKYTKNEIKSVRLRMAHILSDGNPMIYPIAANPHLEKLKNWMNKQKPLVCANRDGLILDLTSDRIFYFLQPTRIIDRKRIEKDLHLIAALLKHPTFRCEFERNTERQIILHITGPAPIEHQADLENVLEAYIDVLSEVPDSMADRIFLAFSVGTEEHVCFLEKGFKSLCIEDIYRLATAIVFPSKTEGRGLPIIESCAAGVPIICSRYQPEQIFADVVGESLAEEQQIQYILFPEEDFSESLLNEITDLLIYPEKGKERKEHNIKATRQRYGPEIMKETLKKFLIELINIK